MDEDIRRLMELAGMTPAADLLEPVEEARRGDVRDIRQGHDDFSDEAVRIADRNHGVEPSDPADRERREPVKWNPDDPFDMLFDEEQLNKPVMSVSELAELHGVSEEEIETELRAGINIEMDEHTLGHTEADNDTAMKIALAHLEEIPDYYTQLHYMEQGAVDETIDFDVNKSPERDAVHEFVNNISTNEKAEFELMLKAYVEDEGHISDNYYADFGKQIMQMMLERYNR